MTGARHQRFALFFQERRPFFLDSRDVFEASRIEDGSSGRGTSGELLYTRAVVDPSVGARTTGKSGAFTYGALYARDASPAFFHYDGYESSGVVQSLGVGAHDLVARIRADVLADSWFGATVLSRRAGDSRSSVAAGDLSLRPGAWSLRAQGGWSSEVAPNDLSRSPFLDGRRRTGGYYASTLRHSARAMSWTVSAGGIAPGYRNQLGRYSRVGVEGMVTDARIARGRVLWQLSRTLGVRVIGEYSNQVDAAGSPFSQRTTRYSASALLSLEMAPASFLYIGYNDALQDFDAPITDPGRAARREGNQVFLKCSYLFRFS